MKRPVTPPFIGDLLARVLRAPEGTVRFETLWQAGLGPAPGNRYRHWDTFRHAPPLAGFSAEEQWLVVRTARDAMARPFPLRDEAGRPFTVGLPAPALDMLHRMDREVGGAGGGVLAGLHPASGPATRDGHRIRSIMEEAITSSQLEGASTTRRVARAMLREGRPAATRSERMIRNNYDGMRMVREQATAPLTPTFIRQLQQTLTEGTLDDGEAAGRLRRTEEHIVIEDETGTLLHRPPPADQLPARLEALCAFANGEAETEFWHPVVRAILLHFWLAYDHPFVDGNGRTGRALFYWAMARAGYWWCEYVSISRILRTARGSYSRAYLYVETDRNDATYFVLHQLRTIGRGIADLQAYLQQEVRALHDVEGLVSRARLGEPALNGRQLAVLREALATTHPRFTVAAHQRTHGTSYQTARTDLLRLASLGLLWQAKVGKAFVFVPPDDLAARLQGQPSGRHTPDF